MARFDGQGRVISDDGEWAYMGDKRVRMWERIAPPAKKPSFVQRLLVKESALGRPGLRETQEAAKLAGSLFDTKAGELADRARAHAEELRQQGR